MKRCLYCDQAIEEYLIVQLLQEDDLCVNCRNKLKARLRFVDKNGMRIWYLYSYDEFFARLLLQYKEGHDEALKDVFLYPYGCIFSFLFKKYQIIYVPSSKQKTLSRGFLPMRLIMDKYKPKEYCEVKMHQELIQENKSLDERKKMIDNYELEKVIKKDSHIMLVDDVCTGGSSLLGVYKHLKKYTKHIIVFSLALVHQQSTK